MRMTTLACFKHLFRMQLHARSFFLHWRAYHVRMPFRASMDYIDHLSLDSHTAML